MRQINSPLSSSDQYILDYVGVIESIHNVVIAINSDKNIVVYNRACEKLFGYSPEEALGKYILDIVPYSGLIKVLENGSSHIGRKFYSNNQLYVSNRTPIKRNGKIIGAVGVAQEITELQSIANELEYVKELNWTMETILETAYDGLIVVNADGLITHLNMAFAEIFKLDQQQVIGKHVGEAIKDSRLPKIIKDGNEEFGDVINVNGKEIVVSRFPIHKSGKIVGAVGKVMFKDVKKLFHLANKVSKLNSELKYYKNEIQKLSNTKYSIDSIIGESIEIQKLKKIIRRISNSISAVLIMGESGTGKELIAHSLHRESLRSTGPFIKVNCAAMPENLLESELFGYCEGAFTGAKKGGQIGKFEQAHGGTIFLDEIGDMPLSMQVKLLRVLQEKEIEPLGSTASKKVDVRVISATNRNLRALISEGKFREDLFYRLNVVPINIPPLREREEDIKILVEHFCTKFNYDFGLSVKELSLEVWQVLLNYHWPGNIRELENVIEQIFNVIESETIGISHLPVYLRVEAVKKNISLKQTNLKDLLETTEREAIIKTLKKFEGNKAQAAKALGISRAWLYQRLEKHKIDI